MIPRSELEALVSTASADELPDLIGALETAKARAQLRLLRPVESGASVPEFLEPDQAARLCGVKKKWLLEQTRGQPFRRDLGHRTKRFEKEGLLRWLETALP